MIELPDANVLIALLDEQHQNHAPAKEWFREVRKSAWATCSVIENAAIRIIGNPNYGSSHLLFADVAQSIHKMKQDFVTTHHFWQDSVSLADPAQFDLTQIRGHNQLTDCYLLGLCKQYGGRFVTFDKGIDASLLALVNPPVDLVRLLKTNS